MPIELKNKNISLLFHLFEEGYQGTRFSQIGKLAEVQFKGIKVTSSELKTGFSAQHGAGFYNEFDIDTALNFDEVKQGEWFHKIGVGLLKKEGEDYDFMKKYEAQYASLIVEPSEDQIAFTANQKIQNGFGYQLQQAYLLNEDGFTIKYTLKNTGEKAIKTVEYNHNFLQLNKERIGDKYTLNFNDELLLSDTSEVVNPDDVMNLNSDKLTFNQTPTSDFFVSDLKSPREPLSWELTLEKQLSIYSNTDGNPSKMNIWGVGHVISPELFLNIEVAPGDTYTWQRNYKFKVPV